MSRWKKKEEFLLTERMRLLAEWYGSSVAGTELAAHSPQPRPVGDCLREFTEKIFSPEIAIRIRLEENWEKIAGRQLAALTRVSAFSSDGTLTLEVRHNAFLRELSGTEDLLPPRINAFLGQELCRRAVFSATENATPHYRPRALGGNRKKGNR